MARMKWRHPSSAGQLVMKYQAMRDEKSWPMGHHTERRVSSDVAPSGSSSRKRAPSTGRLPPTPKPRAAKRKQTQPQVGA